MRPRTGLVIGLISGAIAAIADKLTFHPELMLIYTIIGGGLAHAVGQLLMLLLGRFVE